MGKKKIVKELNRERSSYVWFRFFSLLLLFYITFLNVFSV